MSHNVKVRQPDYPKRIGCYVKVSQIWVCHSHMALLLCSACLPEFLTFPPHQWSFSPKWINIFTRDPQASSPNYRGGSFPMGVPAGMARDQGTANWRAKAHCPLLQRQSSNSQYRCGDRLARPVWPRRDRPCWPGDLSERQESWQIRCAAGGGTLGRS